MTRPNAASTGTFVLVAVLLSLGRMHTAEARPTIGYWADGDSMAGAGWPCTYPHNCFQSYVTDESNNRLNSGAVLCSNDQRTYKIRSAVYDGRGAGNIRLQYARLYNPANTAQVCYLTWGLTSANATEYQATLVPGLTVTGGGYCGTWAGTAGGNTYTNNVVVTACQTYTDGGNWRFVEWSFRILQSAPRGTMYLAVFAKNDIGEFTTEENMQTYEQWQPYWRTCRRYSNQAVYALTVKKVGEVTSGPNVYYRGWNGDKTQFGITWTWSKTNAEDDASDGVVLDSGCYGTGWYTVPANQGWVWTAGLSYNQQRTLYLWPSNNTCADRCYSATKYTELEHAGSLTWGTINPEARTIAVTAASGADGYGTGSFSNLSAGSSGLYFEARNSGGTVAGNSGWVKSASVTVTVSAANDSYYFRVRGRNGSGDTWAQWNTQPMQEYIYQSGSSFMDIQQPGAPTFGSVGVNNINVIPSGTFDNLTAGSSGLQITNATSSTVSGWQQNQNAWNNTGLSANRQYTYRTDSRNRSGGTRTGSATASKYTLSVAPTSGSLTPSPTIQCVNSSVVWTNNLGFGVGGVQYFKYAFNTSPTYSFSGSEPNWSSSTLSTTPTSGGTWYLHVRGYNGENVLNGNYSYSVTVRAAYSVGAISGGGGSICSGGDPGAMTATASGGSSLSYLWYYKDGTGDPSSGGTSTGVTTATYDPPSGLTTTRSYRCYIDDVGSPDCGAGTWSTNYVTVTVHPLPATPGGSPTGTTAICYGASTSLGGVTVGTGEVVSWRSGSCDGSEVGTSASGGSLSVSPTSTTTYYARAKNTTTNCLSAACHATTVTVTVNPLPATPGGSPTGTTAICNGASTSLGGVTVGAGEVVSWRSGSCGGSEVGTSASGGSLSVSPTSTTTYYARAKNATTNCLSAACHATTVTVTVNPLPGTPTNAQAAPAYIQTGVYSTLSATVGGNGDQVWWYTDGCGVTQVGGGPGNQSVSPAATTTYYARSRNSSTDCWSTNCATTVVTVDDQSPTVVTSSRQSPSYPYVDPGNLIFRVTFSEPMLSDAQHIDLGDFAIEYLQGAQDVDPQDSGLLSISPVTGGGASQAFDVTVRITLVADPQGITEARLNVQRGTAGHLTDRAGNLCDLTQTYVRSTYILDKKAPTVTSCARLSPATSPTNAAQVTFRVTFSESVDAGTVQSANLVPASTNLSTPSVQSWTPISGATSTLDVTVNTGNLSPSDEYLGTLKLNVVRTSPANIQDLAGNSLGSDFSSGQSYSIDRAAPTIIHRSPAANTPVGDPFTSLAITFSESVQGTVQTSDLSITVDGTPYTVTQVSGAGAGPYTFTFNNPVSGTVHVAVGTAISDPAGNLFAGDTWTHEKSSTPRIPSLSNMLSHGSSGEVGLPVTNNSTQWPIEPRRGGAHDIRFDFTERVVQVNPNEPLSAAVELRIASPSLEQPLLPGTWIQKTPQAVNALNGDLTNGFFQLQVVLATAPSDDAPPDGYFIRVKILTGILQSKTGIPLENNETANLTAQLRGLQGDVGGNGNVATADVMQIKEEIIRGTVFGPLTAYLDVNMDGAINTIDMAFAKSRVNP